MPKELYNFYRDNLSYMVLITNGKDTRERILAISSFAIPFLLTMIFIYCTDFNVQLKSCKMIFLTIFLVLLISLNFILPSLVICRTNNKRKNWFKHQKNPDELSDDQLLEQLRKNELDKFLLKHGIHSSQQIEEIIRKLKEEQSKARDQLIVLIGLIGGAIALLNDDFKTVIFGELKDERTASFFYILFVIAAITPIYKMIMMGHNQDYGKWINYKQMIGILEQSNKSKVER